MKKQVGPYMLQELIGKSSFGQVYKSLSSQDNTYYAIKMLAKEQMTSEEVDLYENELSILQLLQHNNIVRLHDVKKSAHHYYIVLEYCEGCTLEDYVRKKGRVEELTARTILRQLTSALNKLYELPATHRNLKLSKILLTNLNDPQPIVKLTGFRHAQLGEDSKLIGADLMNVAPEVKRGKSYTRSADIWSLGSITYQMLTGMQIDRTKGKYELDTAIKISTEAIDFISRTVQYNPSKRIVWEDLVAHPFLATDKVTEFDFEKFAVDYLLNRNSLGFIELDADQQYDPMKYPLLEKMQSLANSNEEEKKVVETPSNSLNIGFLSEGPANKEQNSSSGSLGGSVKKSIVFSIKENWIKDPLPKKHTLKPDNEFITKTKKHKGDTPGDVGNDSDFEILTLDSLAVPIRNLKKKVREAEQEYSVKIEGNINIAEGHFK